MQEGHKQDAMLFMTICHALGGGLWLLEGWRAKRWRRAALKASRLEGCRGRRGKSLGRRPRVSPFRQPSPGRHGEGCGLLRGPQRVGGGGHKAGADGGGEAPRGLGTVA